MVTSGSADQGHIQGMIVKVKPQGDGTLRFDVTCHDSKGRLACRERFLLPQKSSLQESVRKGMRARVIFEITGRERNRPISIEIL